LPLAIGMACAIWGGFATLAFLIYPVQVARLGLGSAALGRSRWLRALFLVLGKFPESQGVLKSWWTYVRQRRAVLIEYK
jgi:hypothetical protein